MVGELDKLSKKCLPRGRQVRQCDESSGRGHIDLFTTCEDREVTLGSTSVKHQNEKDPLLDIAFPHCNISCVWRITATRRSRNNFDGPWHMRLLQFSVGSASRGKARAPFFHMESGSWKRRKEKKRLGTKHSTILRARLRSWISPVSWLPLFESVCFCVLFL